MDSGSDKVDSDDELSLGHGRRASSDSLKSINLAASVESVHVTFPEQPAAVRRKRSSSGSQTSQESSFPRIGPREVLPHGVTVRTPE